MIYSTLTNTVLLGASLVMLSACGGGSSGDASTDATPTTNQQQTNTLEPATMDSQSIKADGDFSFHTERTIQVLIDTIPNEPGTLHIYYRLEQNADAEILPDPTSRLTSVTLDHSSELTLRINSDTKYLLLNWVPMTAQGEEKNYRYELEANQDWYQWPL